MKAKSIKCRYLIRKKSDIVRTNGRTSTAYDPQLEIGGKEILFIHQSLPIVFEGSYSRDIQGP